MRAIGYAAILGAAVAAIPAIGRAATLTEDFTINVGPVARPVLSSSFPLFDPSLGTLTEITETVIGSTIWSAESPVANLDASIVVGPSGLTTQIFLEQGPITIDLEGTSTAAFTLADFTGVGDTTTPLFLGGGPGILTVGLAKLDGSITYNYKPIPEPSIWAMMLLGFAGLGFAGYRASRRAAVVGTGEYRSVGNREEV